MLSDRRRPKIWKAVLMVVVEVVVLAALAVVMMPEPFDSTVLEERVASLETPVSEWEMVEVGAVVEEEVAFSTYQVACYEEQGGASWVADDGCVWGVRSGGTLEVRSGGTFTSTGEVTFDNITVTGAISDLQRIQFNITDEWEGDHSTGMLYWDDDANTLSLDTNIDDVSLQVGQEQYAKARNDTGALIPNGSVVWVTGAVGNRPTISLSLSSVVTRAWTIGMATEDIAHNADGYVTTFGVVRNIDTSDFADGAQLWVDPLTAGAITSTRPLSTAYNATFVGWNLRGHATQGQVLIAPGTLWQKFGMLTAGDYSVFEADGTLVFEGDARVWDDLRVPAQNTRINPAQSKPDFGSYIDGTFVYLFDPDAEESVHFAAQMPHGWEIGTDIEPHIHWTPTDAGSGDVVWGLECTNSGIGGVMGATSTISVTDAAAGVDNQHQLADFAAMSLSNPSLSAMLVCRMFRDADDGVDDYGADAALLEIDFHFLMDTVGSREEAGK